MKFHIGPIPESPDFNPHDGWTALREPPSSKISLVAIPIAALLYLLARHVWDLVPGSGADRSLFPYSIGLNVLMIICLLIIHELLHAIFQPGFPLSSKCVLGVWPAKGAFFAHYHGAISRNRFLLLLAAPFLTLSVAPLVLAFTHGFNPDLFRSVSILNATGSCMDLFGVCLIRYQIPAGALVRNQGWYTYWRITT